MNGVSTENAVNNTTHNWRDCFFPKKHTGWVPAKSCSHADTRK
jgi:hypothetical protein